MHNKYPRIPHLPWSQGRSEDDISIESCEHFLRFPLVITEKMDGENTTITREKIHARSLDSKDHESRHWLKNWAAQFQWKLPANMRLVGENLYAKHSLHYTNLKSYFYLFGVFMDDRYMSWTDVEDIAGIYDLVTVPVWYKDTYAARRIGDVSTIHEVGKAHLTPNTEGYVLRNTSSFFEDDFSRNIAKYVRKDHVQTDEHWMNKPIVKNGLAA